MKERIGIDISAAVLFFRSLPIFWKFNPVSLGETYRSMFKSPQIYTKDNMNEAIRKLKIFKADMGGTEILDPLMHIFDQRIDIEYPRTEFLLTDGDVSQPKRVAHLVSEHVGNGVDFYLIKEVARAGKGSYSCVTRDIELQITVRISL
jgi:hypothetical protein